jgi:hypothetical protein
MKRLEDMNEPELRELMNHICGGIEFMCGEMGVEKPLFCLVLFNDPAIAQYAANCRREDIIKAMRETARRLEQRQDVTR